MEAQDGVCAMCRQSCASGRKLAIDHDPATGETRGLLCRSCNISLGLLKDRPELLAAGISYLVRSGQAFPTEALADLLHISTD